MSDFWTCLSNFIFSAQSFMDLQFPNGQFTYVSGEGLTTSAFLPVFGGLLQAQGQYPGEMKFSFSCKVSQLVCQIIYRNSCCTCLALLISDWPFSDFHSSLSLFHKLFGKGFIFRTFCRISGEHALHLQSNGPINHLHWVLHKPQHGGDPVSW